jgi:predicted DNA binding CopG/RHH family protein
VGKASLPARLQERKRACYRGVTAPWNWINIGKSILMFLWLTLLKNREDAMKKPLQLPKFKNENEERDFWAKVDLTEYFSKEDFQPVSFPNLKPTSHSISIRMPEYLIDRIKEEANKINIPYQSLIKDALGEKFLTK